jgi:hypothetical protein
MVTNFAAFDELRVQGGDHPAAALRTAGGRSESADGGELCGVAVKLHGLGLLVNRRTIVA